ncbi:MAG: hypothetical protein AMQ22_01996 [Candidatus Methanofastidiosum methylothiophilum]|uniref:Uncharacterized protein n=1 Tax=Candidatus Methanofastidiosum methylothiophilum TaxID=1705564 RepID=A0A150IQB8_9EURY|nr:MAG: hypothetical protein AMQ22_01996 [Candidatus Methanofastidiosum methylthiophilus]
MFLIPPPVEQAQPPMNIRTSNIDLEREGYASKLLVANPVVVIILTA